MKLNLWDNLTPVHGKRQHTSDSYSVARTGLYLPGTGQVSGHRWVQRSQFGEVVRNSQRDLEFQPRSQFRLISEVSRQVGSYGHQWGLSLPKGAPCLYWENRVLNHLDIETLKTALCPLSASVRHRRLCLEQNCF